MSEDNKKILHLPSIFGFGTAVVAFLVLAKVAMACSLAEPTVVIEAQIDKNLLSQQKSCLDQDCLFVLEKNQYGYFSLKRTDDENAGYPGQNIGNVDREGKVIRFNYFLFYQNDKVPLDKTAFVEALDRLIENDITDIKPILFQEIENWMKGSKGPFLDGGLMFTLYEQDKESKLLEDKNQLFDCHYAEYKRVGNWLVINATSRDYCYLARGGGGMCPSTVISYPKFFAFLLSNINEVTAPYLVAFVAFLVLIIGVATFVVYLVVYLIRKKELWFF